MTANDMLRNSSVGSDVQIILCGTDPETARGGIGVVMSGYLTVLESIPVTTEMMPTYRPGLWSGKWQPWLTTLLRLPGRLRAVRRQARRPIVYSHCGALPSMVRESAVLVVARLFGARTILQVHARQMDRYMHHPILRSIVRMLFRSAHCVCALTPWWAAQMESARMARRLFVVPNPLPPDLEEMAKTPLETALANEEITVLTMARLVSGKGADIAIRAMRGIGSGFKLIVAGDGDQKPDLERLAADLGVADSVHFTGWVSGDEKDRLLREAAVFCLPSTNDVFPMSVVEAMANGKPVVSVRWGGLPDLVADHETGLLCTPEDPDEVCAALERLADPALRQRMGVRAKERILALSGAQNVGRLLAHVLTEALA